MEKRIIPALRSGKAVICNRFDLSTFAYQIYGRGQTAHVDFLRKMNAYVTEGFAPDVYIYLDVSPEEGLRRVSERADENTRFDNEKLAFHQRVRAGYKKMCTQKRNCFVVDGEQSIEIVADDVEEILGQFI